MGPILMGVAALMMLVGALVVFHILTTRVPQAIARRRVEARIAALGLQGNAGGALGADLIKSQGSGPLPGLDRLAGRILGGLAIGRWIEQSGLKVSVSGLLLTGAGLGAMFGLIAALLTPYRWALGAAFAVGMAIPFGVVRNRRRARLRKFEEQFPEALDLISRAVRSGHAFNTGLKMIADELAAPVGPEFRKTFDEQNFGLSMKDALNNLSVRVPILDVRFFVTAVLIQRETGGNLAEILDNLSHVVRERFKILRQVRVYTAHGRFTGYVLLGLPAVLGAVLFFINPDHMNLLFREPMGHTMLLATAVMQTIGYFWIKKVIKIEV